MSNLGNKAPARLRTFIERIERLEEERKSLADDIADVYQELAGEGFDKAAAKIVLKIRRVDDGLAIYSERSQIVDLYLGALGMLPKEPPRAPAHARVENIEEFQNASGRTQDAMARNGAGAGGDDDASGRPVHHDQDSGVQGHVLGSVSGPAEGEPEGFEPPAFLTKQVKTIADYRPHCLHPEACASDKLAHCRACAAAAGLEAT